jgi:flagellar biosynthesis/type III secretory pathway chaperone
MLNDSKKIEELLLKQLKHLKSLIDSAELKKFAIINNKVDEMEKIAKSESYIIAQIKEIEESRVHLIDEMSTEEFPLKNMKLEEIANCFEKDSANKILKLQKAIKTLVNDLQTRNKRNGDLLLYAIDHFNSFFQTLFAHQNPPNIYTPKGMQNSEVVSGNMFFDKRA